MANMDYSLIAFVMAMVGVSLRSLAIYRIKKRHSHEWTHLGMPDYLDQGPSDIGSNKINSYFIRGNFYRLKDWTLNIICVSMYLVTFIGVLFMVLAIIKAD